MKSRLILCAVLLSLVHAVSAAEPPGLVVRRFTVVPSIGDRIAETGMDEWKDFFGQLGVEWPEGSSIKFFPSLGKLVVKNTQENLRVVEELLAIGPMIPFLIEVQVDFIQFKMEDVEKLARAGELSAPSLLALWRKGEAKLLYTPRVITQSGCEATVKAVTEYIYPTDFEVTIPVSTNAPRSTVVSGVVEPSGFETREVGVILSYLPEVSPDGNMINVTLTPETVGSPTWKDFGSTHERAEGGKDDLPMEQPFFHTHTFSTMVSVANGATVLIAGGMNDQPANKTVFAFLTARLVDINGNPIKTETGERDRTPHR